MQAWRLHATLVSALLEAMTLSGCMLGAGSSTPRGRCIQEKNVGALVVIRGPFGEEEPQWVEPGRGILLALEEAALRVPWNGRRALTLRRDRGRVYLGRQLVAHVWQGLGASEILARLRRVDAAGAWLVLDARALTPSVLDALARRRSLRLAVICPMGRPCGVSGIERLAGVLSALSLKDAELETDALTRVGALGRLEYLSLRGARLPRRFDSALERLEGLRALDLAGVRGGALADALPLLLGRHAALAYLDLSFTDLRLSARHLEALERLPLLATLRLASTPISGRVIAHLARLRALRELDLSLTRLGDSHMEALGEAVQLRSLDLRDTAVTDFGAPHLARLRDLRLLWGPKLLTDVGVGWLDGLGSLVGLALGRAAVTAVGLRTLGRLPHLVWRERSGVPPPEPPSKDREGAPEQGTCLPRGESP